MKQARKAHATVRTEAEKQFVRELATRLGNYQYGEFQASGPKYTQPRGGDGKLAPLPPGAIDRHLSGEQPIALPSTSHPDENKAQVVVYDFDDHDGTGDAQRRIDTVCEFSELLDVPHHVERSGSGTGNHIWLVFDHPIRRDSLLKAARERLRRFNERHPGLALVEGTKGGVAAGKVEVFPSGKLIALPLGRGPSVMLQPLKVDGRWSLIANDEPKLAIIPKQKTGPKSHGRNGREPDRDAALAAFLSTFDPDEFDDWTEVGLKLNASFGPDDDWAREGFIGWAGTAQRPDPRHKQEQKWRMCSEPRYSPATFWFDARDRGYTGPLPFTKKEEREHEAKRLLDGIALHRGQDGLAYALVRPRRLLLIDSEEFADELRLTAFDKGALVKSEEVRELAALAAAKARAKMPSNIALRFARVENTCFVFHADSDCRVTEIDQDGWRICADPPVLFRRGDGMPLPSPQEAGLPIFQEVLNVTDDGLIVLLSWMVNAILRPGGLSPILKITGPHGSAKTSAMRAVVACLDPKIGSFAGPPKSEEDLIVAANGSAIVSFDNASSLAQLSDPLCRLSTGGGLRKRKLYTNHGVSALDVTRPIILTGIDPTVYNQDLVERLVDVPLTRAERLMPDEEYSQLLERATPQMTGALFTLVSQVLRMLPAVPSVGRFRFDTFARIGECVAQIMGRDAGWFAAEYEAQLKEAAKEAAEGDPVLAFILYLCRTQGDECRVLELNSTALLDLMFKKVQNGEIFAQRDAIPPNPRSMSTAIAKIVPTLNDYRVMVRRGAQKSFIFEWEGADVEAFEQFMTAQQPF